MRQKRVEYGLVSIIVNNYNYDRFLKQAINSALNQTYKETEVIVVDDGSTDNSRDIITQYGDLIIPVLKENGGQASAFNAGFEKSKGQFILFLDSDDILLRTAIEVAIRSIGNRNTVKVHWRLWGIDEFGKNMGRLYPNQALGVGDLSEHVIYHGPNSYVSPPTSGNFWTRSFLEEVFPVLECGDKHGADAYLSVLAPLYGNIDSTPEPQSYYRLHSKNFSGYSVLDRITHDLRRYEHYCRIMSEHLQRMGISIDPEIWKGPNTVYAWMDGVRVGTEEVKSLVSAGDTFILVDDAQWGYGNVIDNRRCIPFLERNGHYWGPPPDDETAVKELERLRLCGAKFMVFASPAFWWLEFYQGLQRHLQSNFLCTMVNDRVIVFDLQS
jgi:glycosyltransferase involved in cell wall biosynthesis